MSEFEISWQMVVVVVALIASALVAALYGESEIAMALVSGGLGIFLPAPIRKAP